MTKTKKKPLIITAILSRLVFGLFVPFFVVGYVIYILSKLLRAFGLLLMFKRHSARDELTGFWRVWTSIADIMK